MAPKAPAPKKRRLVVLQSLANLTLWGKRVAVRRTGWGVGHSYVLRCGWVLRRLVVLWGERGWVCGSWRKEGAWLGAAVYPGRGRSCCARLTRTCTRVWIGCVKSMAVAPCCAAGSRSGG